MLVQLSEDKRREIEEGNERLQYLKIKGLIDGKTVEAANKLQPRARLNFLKNPKRVVENEKEYDDKVFEAVKKFYWKPGGRTSVPRQFMM
jgi:hypothetical protein